MTHKQAFCIVKIMQNALFYRLLLSEHRSTGDLTADAKRCFHESFKQRMRTVGPGFQFRVRLCCDKPGMIRYFDHFDDSSVRGNAAEVHAVIGQGVPIVIIDFVTVAVPFMDRFFPI